MRRSDEDYLSVDVDTLRTLFKGLQLWRAGVEDHGLSSLVIPGTGVEWHILDVEMLYRASQTLLAPRQSQAIRLFLFENMRESDVARLLPIAPTNPIGLYATDGLRHLVEMVEERLLP